MNFLVNFLPETWFGLLPVETCAKAKARIPSETQASRWRCVVDERQRVLLTNLISSTGEMRDDNYFYLLAIRMNLFVVTWRLGKAVIVDQCPDPNDSEPLCSKDTVLAIAAESMAVLDQANRMPYRTIVDSNGHSLVGSS